MKIEIFQGNITHVCADAIVNAANSSLLGGGGVDGAIHHAAGPQLREFCQTLGGCAPGEAKVSPGFNLPAKHIIHTVGPIWHDGEKHEAAVLSACYRNCMLRARKLNAVEIVFPAISTGAYGYPLEEATSIALRTVLGFLKDNRGSYEPKVSFCCFSEQAEECYHHTLHTIKQETTEKCAGTGELLIGLGGVGGRALLELRNREQCKRAQQGDSSALCCEYLYLDTSTDVLTSRIDDATQTPETELRKDFIDLKNTISADLFTPDDEALFSAGLTEEELSSGEGVLINAIRQRTGTGGSRRIGQLLFKGQATLIQQALVYKRDSLQWQGCTRMNVRLFCSAGGGTGSGCLAEILTLLSRLLSPKDRLHLYPFIAEHLPNIDDPGSFKENQSALLKELPALPLISPAPGTNARPAATVYLTSDAAPGSPDLTAQIRRLARACYETMVHATCRDHTDVADAASGGDALPSPPRVTVLGFKTWCCPITLLTKRLAAEFKTTLLSSLLQGTNAQEPSGSAPAAELSFHSALAKQYEQQLLHSALEPIDKLEQDLSSGKFAQKTFPSQLHDALDEVTQRITEGTTPYAFARFMTESDSQRQEAVRNVLQHRLSTPASGGGLEGLIAAIGQDTEEQAVSAQRDIPTATDIEQAFLKEWNAMGILTRHLSSRPKTLAKKWLTSARQHAASIVECAAAPLHELLEESARRHGKEILRNLEKICCELQAEQENTTNLIRAIDTRLSAAEQADSDTIFAYDKASFHALLKRMKQKDDILTRHRESLLASIGEDISNSLFNSARQSYICTHVELERLISVVKEIQQEICRSPLSTIAPIDYSFTDYLARSGGKTADEWEQHLRPQVHELVNGSTLTHTVNETSAQNSALIVLLPRTLQAIPGIHKWLKQAITDEVPAALRAAEHRVIFYPDNSEEEIRILYLAGLVSESAVPRHS